MSVSSGVRHSRRSVVRLRDGEIKPARRHRGRPPRAACPARARARKHGVPDPAKLRRRLPLPRDQWGHWRPARAARDQRLEPLPPRLVFFRADHPVRDRPAVPRRAGFEVFHGGGVGLECPHHRRRQLGALALLVRVDRRAIVAARLERRETGGRHAAQVLQLLCALDVDRAPDAASAPRREADRVAPVVDAAADPVDPPEAERFVDRLRPGDARTARVALVETNQQLAGAAMIAREPRAKVGRGGEEAGFHGNRSYCDCSRPTCFMNYSARSASMGLILEAYLAGM